MGKHYNAFVKVVNSGIFDQMPQGTYFRDIKERAKHIQSPVGAHSTLEGFGNDTKKLNDYVKLFLEKGLIIDKAIPLEQMVCVEDNESAVFMENHPEKKRAIKVTTFMDMKEYRFKDDYSIYGGQVKILKLGNDGILYGVSDSFSKIIKNGNLERENFFMLSVLHQGLMSDTRTALEQLAILDYQRKLPDI